MEAIAVERGVPITPKHASAYPLHTMQVGDSFAIPADRAHRAFKACHEWARRHGVKLASRKQPDGSRRIWRVA